MQFPWKKVCLLSACQTPVPSQTIRIYTKSCFASQTLSVIQVIQVQRPVKTARQRQTFSFITKILFSTTEKKLNSSCHYKSYLFFFLYSDIFSYSIRYLGQLFNTWMLGCFHNFSICIVAWFLNYFLLWNRIVYRSPQLLYIPYMRASFLSHFLLLLSPIRVNTRLCIFCFLYSAWKRRRK